MNLVLRKIDYKFLISTIFLVIFSFFILDPVLADYSVKDAGGPLGGAQETGKESGYSATAGESVANGSARSPKERIAMIVGQVVGVAISLLGVIFFILGLMGVMDIMAANGSEELVTKGKERIKKAFIGMFVILCAYWLSQLFVFFLGYGIFKP